MNILTLTDTKLAQFGQAVATEARRRALIAVNGNDPTRIVFGNEMAKRSLMIAAAGKHSILLVGPANSGKTMLRAIGLELGLEEIYEARQCPCGNYPDPHDVCNCTPRQLERTVAKFPPTDMTIQICRPNIRDQNHVGMTIADLRYCVANVSRFTDQTLDENGANLLKASVAELPLDPATVARILRVARTIANLDQSEPIQPIHLCEAINYRPLSRESR